jgi:hypothetical protein
MNIRKLESREFKVDGFNNIAVIDFNIIGDKTIRNHFARILLNRRKRCRTIFFYGIRTNHEAYQFDYKKSISVDDAKNIVEKQYQKTVFEYLLKVLNGDEEKIIETFNLNLIKNNS